MLVNKPFTYLTHISERKKSFNVKCSTYYFHVKTNILADFQIWISIPSNSSFIQSVLQNNQLNGILYYCPIVTRKKFVQLIGNRQKKTYDSISAAEILHCTKNEVFR